MGKCVSKINNHFIFDLHILFIREHVQAHDICCQPLKEYTTAVDIKLYMLLNFFLMHIYILERFLVISFRSTIRINIETNHNTNGTSLHLRNKCGLRTHN